MATNTALATLPAGLVPFVDAATAAGAADWAARASAALKGAPLEKLISTTEEGVRIAALAARMLDGVPIAPLRGARPWRVPGRVDHPDAEEANRLALADLDGGADALDLLFAGTLPAFGFGLPARAEALATALASVEIDKIALRLCAAGPDMAQALVDYAAANNYAPEALTVSFGLAPPRNGMEADRIRAIAARGYRGPIVALDGRVAHERGAGEALEIAIVLAEAEGALRALDGAGTAPETARPWFAASLAAGADIGLTIAKFRALRLCFARFDQALGLTPAPLAVHAETSWRMMSRLDPYTNLLRTTGAAFAAAVGGADHLSVLPFTTPFGLADGFARRLSRNTNHVLIAESQLWRVIDPTAGAGAIEAMTASLAELAWETFRAIIAAGGSASAGGQALVATRIGEARARREGAIATGKTALIGVNIFPLADEPEVAVLAPLPDGADLPARVSAPFEALRARAPGAAGHKPRVFLAEVGSPLEAQARATFARNFFALAGFSAQTAGDGPPESVATAFSASGAKIAVLCGPDALYAERAVPLAAALAQAGAVTVLAGRPGALAEPLAQAGLVRHIALGTDALAFLSEALDVAAA